MKKQDRPSNSGRSTKTTDAGAAPIYIVSGGVGASGRQLVNTVLAQFPDFDVPVVMYPNVSTMGQIEEVLARAADTQGTIVHTLVDGRLREAMNRLNKKRGLSAVDLMGPLIERLSLLLGVKPTGRPGLYRSLKRQYFERVEAIDFSAAHDDGQNIRDVGEAEIVLVGVSRVGKTPLSMYLAMLGWKVANVPYISGQPPLHELEDVDRGRVIGLTVDAERLLAHRKMRYHKFGITGKTSYTDLQAVFEEVEQAFLFFRRHGYTVIDVTDKPLETSADEVVEVITARFDKKQDKPSGSSV